MNTVEKMFGGFKDVGKRTTNAKIEQIIQKMHSKLQSKNDFGFKMMSSPKKNNKQHKLYEPKKVQGLTK